MEGSPCFVVDSPTGLVGSHRHLVYIDPCAAASHKYNTKLAVLFGPLRATFRQNHLQEEVLCFWSQCEH
jgi:hypothetical protein